ncbi:MAG: hypothetical protein ABW360_03565 [Phenylobacterium sp.]
MKRLMMFAACAVLVTACSPQKPAAPAAGAVKYNDQLDMVELMGHVIDPAAFAYWRGSGVEITAEGEKDLSPTTEEGWLALENGAAVLIEAGNALQLPGRAREPEADWNRYAQQLSERAVLAMAAAEKHDKQAVFDEGGRVYEVCTACHKQFIIDPMLAEQAKTGAPAFDPLPPLPKSKN